MNLLFANARLRECRDSLVNWLISGKLSTHGVTIKLPPSMQPVETDAGTSDREELVHA